MRHSRAPRHTHVKNTPHETYKNTPRQTKHTSSRRFPGTIGWTRKLCVRAKHLVRRAYDDSPWRTGWLKAFQRASPPLRPCVHPTPGSKWPDTETGWTNGRIIRFVRANTISSHPTPHPTRFGVGEKHRERSQIHAGEEQKKRSIATGTLCWCACVAGAISLIRAVPEIMWDYTRKYNSWRVTSSVRSVGCTARRRCWAGEEQSGTTNWPEARVPSRHSLMLQKNVAEVIAVSCKGMLLRLKWFVCPFCAFLSEKQLLVRRSTHCSLGARNGLSRYVAFNAAELTLKLMFDKLSWSVLT